MKIAITGGTGFIGSRFLDLYANEFEKVHLLARNCQSKNNKPKNIVCYESSLSNYDSLNRACEDVDAVIHCAFDHSYKENIIGICNLLKACMNNKVKKLIYISSYVVYDYEHYEKINENSSPSCFYDPYTLEKKRIERELEKYKSESIDITILQPTIVFGLGGAWTRQAFYFAKSSEILLPKAGNGVCNAIYVDDVASAIKSSIFKSGGFNKYLLSGESVSWKDFYQSHARLLSKYTGKETMRLTTDNGAEFSNSNWLNILLKIWFKTRCGYVLNLLTNVAKKVRGRKYQSVYSLSDLRKFILSTETLPSQSTIGMTRCVHSSLSVADTTKAELDLDFQPRYDFQKGVLRVQKELERVMDE
ncbi:NAD-dependent epimerase/dehydratase family protein [Facilibium subflavum]|uniref:NAD-dependent epimerase/dehydratase family protein n=1 Tax=Facilibium subflavum TaxID=2219058 RepID=UPI000E65CC63|nr:NAD(P)-dependent oxidoreductase [Facilibium subflavum]